MTINEFKDLIDQFGVDGDTEITFTFNSDFNEPVGIALENHIASEEVYINVLFEEED